jgi:hypothetical protein
MIKEIVTHGGTVDLDEAYAYIMLKRNGEDKIPGVSTANFRQITAEDDLEELKKREDILLLGLGGGPFDEHVGDEGKTRECCATLVAKFLGLDQDFCLQKILKYVLHTDKNPPNLTLDLAPTIVRFQKQGYGLNVVLAYTEMTIDAAYEDQKNVKEEAIMVNGRESFIAITKGDDLDISRFMRLFGAAVIVVENSRGQISIMTNREYALDLRDILRIIRIWEQKKDGGVQVKDWKTLEIEASIPALHKWFFHKDSNSILNGGPKRPDVPATKLSLNEVVSAVKLGVDKSFGDHCQGRCVDTRKRPCGWYELGLLRCRSTRFASLPTK